MSLDRPEIDETKMTGEWLKMLSKHVRRFLKVNGLQPTEELAIKIAEDNTSNLKKHHLYYKHVESLYKAIEAFVENKFPTKTTNVFYIILEAINGRFGNRVLKPKFRIWWLLLTYGTLTVLLFKFILIPFGDFWSGLIDYLNYLRWYK